jgi:hypothetical protein
VKNQRTRLLEIKTTLDATVGSGQTNLPLLEFWQGAKPFRTKIMNDNIAEARVFAKTHGGTFEVLRGVDLEKEWDALASSTQDAIVSYFKAMFLLAEAYNNKARLAKIAIERRQTAKASAAQVEAEHMQAIVGELVAGQVSDELQSGMRNAAGVIDAFIAEHGHMPRGSDEAKILLEMSKQRRRVEE